MTFTRVGRALGPRTACAQFGAVLAPILLVIAVSFWKVPEEEEKPMALRALTDPDGTKLFSNQEKSFTTDKPDDDSMEA